MGRVHGESRSRRVSRRTNMKNIFVVAAFLAMALGAPQEQSGPNPEAEADPWYGYYGYRPYGYGYYGHRYYGYYGKRSAEAEPTAEAAASPEAEADPWYGYYGYGLHRPYGYGYYGYRPYGYGYYYGKRSADAEPIAEATASPEAEADPWYGYYGYGL